MRLWFHSLHIHPAQLGFPIEELSGHFPSNHTCMYFTKRNGILILTKIRCTSKKKLTPAICYASFSHRVKVNANANFLFDFDMVWMVEKNPTVPILGDVAFAQWEQTFMVLAFCFLVFFFLSRSAGENSSGINKEVLVNFVHS